MTVAFKPIPQEELRDLGFGSVVTREARARLLNRDGSFNVARRGLSFWESLSVYHWLLMLSWPRYLTVVMGAFMTGNALFALGYLACGPAALDGPGIAFAGSGFWRAFFFSVQTLATIGYGHVHPATFAANLLVTFESLAGLLGFALVTGIVFARFSRPTARIRFSQKALIAPYRGGTAFEFRIANARSNEIIELEAEVLFSRLVVEDGKPVRRFHTLELERSRVAFFPLSWTIVHPIGPESPMWGVTSEDLAKMDAEFLVLLKGVDETFSELVHARSSYKPHEIAWGARFSSALKADLTSGGVMLDVGRIDEVEPVG